MALAKHTYNNQSSARDFKHRVLTCLNKLSDRDTHSAAATELESIAKTLTRDSVSPFLSSISATDSSDKSPVRKQCVRLISTLSEAHGDALSSHLSKLLSAVVRRLRDPDTTVRSACIAAACSIASHITKPPFTSVAKPFVDALVTEQDLNSQIGAALCLASAIDGAPNPELSYLRRLLPRIEKLLKWESFKAKAALLTVVGSVIGVGAASSPVTIRNLVKVLVEFVVKSEDWCVRKAAAEALEKLALMETDFLSEFKAPCLKTFEAKKFDKVKGVRERMNQMIEVWKAIPDDPKELSPPPESPSSSKEVASDGRYPPRTPQITNKQTMPCVGSSITTVPKRRISLENGSKKTGPAMFRRLDRKKPNNQKLNIAATAPATLVSENDDHLKSRLAKPETKRALFNTISNDTIHESQGHDERSSSTVARSNATEKFHDGHKDCEDLSLIRNQLVQIQTQQSNLFDLLQEFIGSSQNGMQSLESRVHGLELTLDEISFDLARSTGRMSNAKPTETVCCRLPGADYLSSKLWKKSQIQLLNSRYSSPPAMGATANMNGKIVNHKYPENRGLIQLHKGGHRLTKNPLAEIHRDFHGISEIASVHK